MGNPPIMKTTTSGGVVSIFCFVGLVVVVVCLTAQHIYNNDEETRSVLPEPIAPGSSNGSVPIESQHIEAILLIQGHNQRGMCTDVSTGFGVCLGEVEADLQGIQCAVLSIACEFRERKGGIGDCNLRARCDEAKFNISRDEYHILLGITGGMNAEVLTMRLSVGTGIPSETSNTSVTILAPEQQLLRGNIPTVAYVDSYPTVYVYRGKASGRGVLVQASGYETGSAVTDSDYYKHDGVRGKIIFNLLRASTIVIERRKIIPLLTFLASMFGTLSAWMGFCSILVYVGDLITSYQSQQKAKKFEEIAREAQDMRRGSEARVLHLRRFDDPLRPEWDQLVRPLVGAGFTLCQTQTILPLLRQQLAYNNDNNNSNNSNRGFDQMTRQQRLLSLPANKVGKDRPFPDNEDLKGEGENEDEDEGEEGAMEMASSVSVNGFGRQQNQGKGVATTGSTVTFDFVSVDTETEAEDDNVVETSGKLPDAPSPNEGRLPSAQRQEEKYREMETVLSQVLLRLRKLEASSPRPQLGQQQQPQQQPLQHPFLSSTRSTPLNDSFLPSTSSVPYPSRRDFGLHLSSPH